MLLAPVLQGEAERLARRASEAAPARFPARAASTVKSETSTSPASSRRGAGEFAVDVVVDRLVAAAEQRSRVADSLELAFREGGDRAFVLSQKTPTRPLAGTRPQPAPGLRICGDVFENLTPRHFSFNHPEGACPECGGPRAQAAAGCRTGRSGPGEIRPGRRDQAVADRREKPHHKHNAILKQLAEQLPFDPERLGRTCRGDARGSCSTGTGDRLFAFKLRRMREARPMPFAGVWPTRASFRDTEARGFRAR